MENSMSRILIETMVRQTLRGFQEDPERSIRNSVDMALQFSKGRFQRRFFETARTWLKNEDSAYYGMVRDAANHIETEHLVKLGMNIGYNSCTWGSKCIRINEKRLGCKIPWTILFQMDSSQCSDHFSQYDSIINEGEQLGIYCWMLLPSSVPMDALFLPIERHPNSAFFLFCRPEDVTAAALDEIASLKHLMVAVRWDDKASETCAMLRNARLPYSVYYPYSQNDLQFILNEDLFCDTQQLHPLFTVLAAKPDCPTDVRRLVYQTAIKVRSAQHYQTLPWELFFDTQNLNEIISDDTSYAFFDAQGRLLDPDCPGQDSFGNLFEKGLTSLLRQAYPKAVMA